MAIVYVLTLRHTSCSRCVMSRLRNDTCVERCREVEILGTGPSLTSASSCIKELYAK